MDHKDHTVSWAFYYCSEYENCKEDKRDRGGSWDWVGVGRRGSSRGERAREREWWSLCCDNDNELQRSQVHTVLAYIAATSAQCTVVTDNDLTLDLISTHSQRAVVCLWVCDCVCARLFVSAWHTPRPRDLHLLFLHCLSVAIWRTELLIGQQVEERERR